MSTNRKRKNYEITRRIMGVTLSLIMVLTTVFGGIGGSLMDKVGLGVDEVYAKDIGLKNASQKQVCDAVIGGTAPTYNGKEYEDVLNNGSVYRGGNSKSGVSENKINYELDDDPNDFAAPLPYGNVFVDTNKLSWTNPADFIIDIKDDRFQWVAVDGQTWTDALGNTTTNDPLESGKKLKQIFEGENKKGGLDDSAANYGFIAYVGELKAYHSDIKTGLDENGYTNEIKAPDGDYLYRIIYLNAATLADGTRGNVMMTMKQVDIETSIEVSENKPRTLTDKEGNTYQYTKAVLPIQGANTMRVAAGVADDQGNYVNEPNVVVKTAEEVDADIAAIKAAGGNVPTSGNSSYLGEKVIRHTVGGAYTFDIEVVDADGNPAVGTMAYAATDLDLPSYQTIWGRSRGTDPFMYAEGLSVLSGTQSYALVPEYNHKDATTLETGWIPDGRTGSLDSALHITAGTGPNADGVRFSSIGEKVLRDKNGLWKDVLFSGPATSGDNTLLYHPTGTIMDFAWDNINNSRVRYKNLNELWDTWVNDSQGKPHYKKTNIRRELAGKIPDGSGGYVPWDQITIQQIADYFGNGSYSVERNDYNSYDFNSYDSGFAVLLDPAKTTLRWTGSSYQSGSAVTTIFDSSLYTYAEATHGTGGGIYFETYDIAGKTCDAQMEEGTVTMGRNEGITATAVPEDGYRVSRILIGDTNYGHGSSVSGLRNYTEYIIDGNDIKVNGEVVGTFSGSNVTGSTGMKTGTVTVSGFNYERNGSKVDITDKITFERNADGTVDVTLPNINNPMHVHVDFDADYYFYKVWKGDSTPESLTMTASPAGVYPTEVTIPMPTGEYEIDGEGNPVAITEMVTFDISGARYTARNGVNAGVEFVLSPNNTVEYVEYEIPAGGGDPVEKFALRSNVVLLGNEFVHYTFDADKGEQIIDARYPVTIETSVADWDSDEAQSFTIDATSDYTDKGYVTVLEKDDAANTISPGNVVWKVKYPSEGVEELGWPALPVEMLPKDDAGAVIPNHEAANHTDRYYWFVTEEVPGWSTESYSNEKAEEPGVIPGGEEGYYGKSKWAAASIKDADTAKELIHEDHEYSYAYMSVFKDGGEITNEPSIVIRGIKEWQSDFDNAYNSRKDIWLHLDAIITNPEDGSKIERNDILPPQMVEASANTTTALSKQWGTKASYTTGDTNIRIVGSTQMVPGNAKLQTVDGAQVHAGPYKYTRRGVTTYYYINELKETDSEGRIYEYSIRETLDWEGNQPVVKDDIDQGLLGYKSEDVADWTEISANEDTYTYKYKYDGENRTAQLKRYTGTVENKYELMDFTVTKKWVDNKEDNEHTVDEIKDKITLYDANGEVDLEALGQNTTNVGTDDEPELEPLGKLTVEPETGKEITLTWKHLPKYIGDGNGNIVYAGYYAQEPEKFEGYTEPMYKNQDEPGTPDVDESTDATKAFNKGVITNAQLINVSVVKVWNDADNQDGKRGDIQVTLYQNGVPYEAEGVTNGATLSEDGATKSKTTVDGDTWTWEKVWTNLPYADASGTKYNYTAQETVKPEDYDSEQSTQQIVLSEWNDAKDTLIFKATNKHNPEKVSFTVTKVWDDADNQDGMRPEKGAVTYTIKARPAGKSEETLSALPEGATIKQGNSDITKKFADGNIAVDTADGDTITISDLNKYAKAGNEIKYTIEEDAIEGYTPDFTGDATKGFTVKNTHTSELGNLKVVKIWNDANNQDGKRVPTKVTLYKQVGDAAKTTAGVSDAEVDVTDGTATVSGETSTEYTWANLPIYEDGKQIKYSVVEAAVPGYVTVIEPKDAVTLENGKTKEITITNTYTTETVTIQATKVWDDNNDFYRIRRDAEVTLLANGEKASIADATKTISKDATGDALTVEWTVPKYADGKEIEYTVSESMEPYGTEITGDAAKGFTITNTYPPKKETTTVTRKITYTYLKEDGEIASATVEQRVELERTPKTIDPETGEVTEWNDWTIVDDANNKDVESPEIKGWTPDKTSVPKIQVKDLKLDENGYPKSPNDEHVIYTPEPPVGTPDETYGGKGDPQEGTPKFEVTTPTTPDGTPNEIVETKLVDPETGDPTDEVTIEGEGTYKLNEDGTITFTPDPDFVGDATPVKVIGTDKNGKTAETTYTPHVVDNVQTSTAKRIINYYYNDGTKVPEDLAPPVEQTAEFTRKGTVDPKTGKITGWEEWTSPADEVDEVTSPEVPGYKPNRETVEGTTLNPGDNLSEVVIYVPEPEIIKEEETKTITRVIKYRYLTEDGEKAFADVTQTVTFTRIKTTNITTGEETVTEWIPEDETLDKVDSPELETHEVGRPFVEERVINPDDYENGAVIEEYVIYTPKTIWVTYVDDPNVEPYEPTPYLEKTTEPKAATGQKQEEPEAPKDPTKKGYTFDGWDRTVDDKGNITYTAKWIPEEPPVEKTIWVTYVDPDGTTIYLEKTTEPKAKEGEEQVEPDAPKDPTKKGYTFDGWDRTVDEDGNITYTAKWKPIDTPPTPPTPVDPTPEKTYWTTYVDPDGTTIYLEKTYKTVGAAEPPAPANPTKDGYTFDGWDRSVDSDGNITYTARWVPVTTPVDPTPSDPVDPTPVDPTPVDPTPGEPTIWVRYIDGDGNEIYMDKTTFDQTVGEPQGPANPTKDGFIFDGWDRTVDSAGNITYIARWKPVSSTTPSQAKPATNVAKTGDQSNAGMWIGILAIAVLVALIAVLVKVRSKNK